MKVRLSRGLTIAIAGAPAQSICDAPPLRKAAAVVGKALAAAAEPCVEPGDVVRAGAVLFRDSCTPEIRFIAPIGGQVAAVNRDDRRRLVSVVVSADSRAEPVEFASSPREALGSLGADEVRSRLLESGLWTALRSRPFDRVPHPGCAPAAILVTAIETNPLGCDPAVVIAAREAGFVDGVNVLTALTGRVCLCQAPGLELGAGLPAGAEVFEFTGPHPAGLPGTHVAHIEPATESRPVWYIGYQDVIAIGQLFTSGRLSNERVVAVGGPGARRPRLLRTRAGAALDELLAVEVEPDARVILGSALGGREPDPATAYLGRYDTQLTLLRPARIGAKPAVRGPAALWNRFRGASAAMLALERFERLWPLPQPVLALLRAILTGDSARAIDLGCLDLAEEDLALCSYACPGKLDYGAALRTLLDQLEARD